ncbi:hypothetical protein ACIA8O_16485 [Kitasatospora sp. NPDC051853]|uniref:hypothetical protein n=1 Tax=Kitasatospora sp. NPDC051853 TaxID=3364058 RepID=UPI0037B21E87
MNWLALYARSRQVPLSAALLCLLAAAVSVLSRGGDGPPNLPVAALVLTACVAAGSVGLAGQDAELDRTAAIRWAPRRAAHVLLIAAATAAALLTARAAGADLAPPSLVLRDSAGLAGLAALGAVLGGAAYAWTLPTAWLAVTLCTPVAPGTTGEVLSWLVLDPAPTASAWTAWTLFTAGTLVYATAGPRR